MRGTYHSAADTKKKSLEQEHWEGSQDIENRSPCCRGAVGFLTFLAEEFILQMDFQVEAEGVKSQNAGLLG